MPETGGIHKPEFQSRTLAKPDRMKRVGKRPRSAGTKSAANRPGAIDDYLALQSPLKRKALENLRRIIRSTAPKAEECISYSIPAFRLGKILVGFAAGADHCSFYPMNGSTVQAFASELKGFSTSKGTIRFTPEHPLPAALVRRIVKARLAEIVKK